MAKAQVTEAQLSESLRSIGNVGGLTAKAVRRDSPFGTPEPKPAEEVRESTKQAKIHKVVETESLPKASTHKPVPVKKQSAKSVRRPMQSKVAELETVNVKRDLEDVTVPLAPSVRDSLGKLARDLQRRRTEKKHNTRITANTLIRVAIDHLLEELTLDDGDSANTEAELLQLVRRKLRHS